MSGFCRLWVREKSGAWYVDQGLMRTETAEVRRLEWNAYGFCTVRIKWRLAQ